MSECKFCCEDINNLIINVFDDGVKEQSQSCKNCTIMLINTILPRLLNSISEETCESSIKKIVKNNLPTHLSIDGTGRGKQIISVIIDDEIIDAKLKHPDNVNIDNINIAMKQINNLALKDDDLFLYVKEETFNQFKKN
jgi:hypothetical protein